jgi:hypothetical protein
VIADLLGQGRSLDLYERPVGEAELGDPARAAAGAVIAVLRGGTVLAPDDPRAVRLEKGDQLIMVSTRVRPAGPS